MWFGEWSKNEVILLCMIGFAIVIALLLPRKLTKEITILSWLWGLASGLVFDFTIGGGIIDFYTVNDSPHYELFDGLYYLLFAPFGYFFIYFYETFHISKYTFIYYILIWTLIGIGMNWIFIKSDIIAFQNGFSLTYSFSVFLLTQTITALAYEQLKKAQQHTAT
ncbi:hypothetical protein ACR3I8_08740 [Priestia flexa]|uniref:hypothetical protein n=1 Tax=Priestia flexa TaxID=86664 RepID=UPI0021FE0933|nr:hypothetical protein [Priestia flexa]MDT2046226.1 hypothetical protein [Priestia flexa]USY53750.1 hypothetical protein NIZ91_13405 [Bacillus sp. 1780r2a1]